MPYLGSTQLLASSRASPTKVDNRKRQQLPSSLLSSFLVRGAVRMKLTTPRRFCKLEEARALTQIEANALFGSVHGMCCFKRFGRMSKNRPKGLGQELSRTFAKLFLLCCWSLSIAGTRT